MTRTPRMLPGPALPAPVRLTRPWPRTGLTLLEISLGIVVGSLLFIAATRLFSGSLEMTRRGSGHLTNIQAAGLLLTQIEQDIARAVTFESPAAPGPATGFKAAVVTGFGGGGNLEQADVTYEPVPGGLGYRRTMTAAGQPPKARVMAADRQVTVTLERIALDIPGKHAWLVEVAVSSPPQGTERERIRRFVFPQNHDLANLTDGWTF